MSLNNFIPQLWADTILTSLQKNLIYGRLFNDDYEGKITQLGDTVKINAIGDITISNYVKDTDIAAPQSINDAGTMLTISQAKTFNFAIDDVDQMQANPRVMAESLRWAGYKLAEEMDRYYAGFYTDASTLNLIGSSGSPVTPTRATEANVATGTTVYDYLVQIAQKLTEAAIPKRGRWCVIPPWCKTLLTQDVRFTSFNTSSARATIMSGRIDGSSEGDDAYVGRVEGMDIYESLNAPHLSGTVGTTGSVDVVFAGHSMAASKAEGLAKTEAYRPEKRFSDAVKGLCLYGAKIIRPNGIAVAYLQHPA